MASICWVIKIQKRAGTAENKLVRAGQYKFGESKFENDLPSESSESE